MEGTPVGGAVAEEGDGDPFLPPVFGREGRPGADVDGRAHDPVGAQHLVGHVGDVHGPALTAAVAVRAAVELGEHAVGITASGEQVAVAPVAGDYVVLILQNGHDSRGDGLLSAVEMKEAGHASFEERLVCMLLKRPDAHHAAVEV